MSAHAATPNSLSILLCVNFGYSIPRGLQWSSGAGIRVRLVAASSLYRLFCLSVCQPSQFPDFVEFSFPFRFPFSALIRFGRLLGTREGLFRWFLFSATHISRSQSKSPSISLQDKKPDYLENTFSPEFLHLLAFYIQSQLRLEFPMFSRDFSRFLPIFAVT